MTVTLNVIGYLHIYRIRASKLKNVEMLGKQDPFIIINYDNLFEYKTSALQSGIVYLSIYEFI